jgi:hypothetical protein
VYVDLVWVWCGCFQKMFGMWARQIGSIGGRLTKDPKWAWWLGGAFVHKVGIWSVILIVGVCGLPGFLPGMVGGGEECL